jgi:hypothetical protein
MAWAGSEAGRAFFERQGPHHDRNAGPAPNQKNLRNPRNLWIMKNPRNLPPPE